MKKRLFFLMLFSVATFIGCTSRDTMQPLFSENVRLKIDIPKDFGVFDYDGQYLYASSFVEEETESEGISGANSFYHRIDKNSGEMSSAKAGLFRIGFYNFLHMGDRIYTTIHKKDDESSGMTVVDISADAGSEGEILPQIQGLSYHVKMKKMSDRELMIWNPKETSLGYEHEIFLYNIKNKSFRKIIHTNYDNKSVHGKAVQAFGADENLERIYLYVDEYKMDSAATLLPQKTSVQIYDTQGQLLQEHILNIAEFMDLSDEFKDMKDFIQDIFVKNNVMVLQTRNGRVKAYFIEPDGLREISFEGASDDIRSMRVLNLKIEENLYILFEDAKNETANFLYILNTRQGSFEKIALNFNHEQIRFFSIIPNLNDDTLFCGITNMDLTGEEDSETMYFLIQEKDFRDKKKLISDDLLFENKERMRDMNE